jgi:integrase
MTEGCRRTPRKPLTKRTIDATRYTGKGRSPCMVWDGALPNFGLRIQPTGRKSFALFYRTENGTKRLVTVARYPEATLDQARKRAHRLLAEVLEGGDPGTRKRQAREAIRFDELADAYLEGHAKVQKRSWKTDVQRIRDYLVPLWGSRKAETIKRRDVAELHRIIGRDHPTTANRVLKLVSVIFNWGEQMGYLREAHPNPTRGVRLYPEQSRDRWLSAEEVQRLFAVLDSEPSPYVRAFFLLSLFTGARKSELLEARWADVDLDNGLLRLPQTKAGRRHYVPLSQPAQKILASLPREVGSPFVFPSERGPGHLVNVSKPWKRLCTRACIENARLHDLRRTVGSWLAQGGASLPLIGRVLNHSTPGATQVYAHLAEVNARDALEHHGSALIALTGLKPARASMLQGGD